MLDNEKEKKLNIVLNNLEDNFIDDYEFWKNLVSDINISLKSINPDTPGFTYNEFCKFFKTELESYTGSLEAHQNIDLNTIHQAVKQIILTKISKKSP